MSSLFAAIISIICATRLSASLNTNDAHQIITSTSNEDDDTKYVVKDDALNMLTTTVGPYRIISVIGQARKGKSTTLNSVISELIGNEIEPFKTSRDLDACTQGMWMYVVPKCDCVENEDNGYCYTNCVKGDYSYIFLDIEGSDTSKDDVAVRYASIATLLSSKVFLLIHESLFAHDIDHVSHIDTFVKVLNKQNIKIPIDLGIIIREPLGDLIKGKLQHKVNELFQEFSGKNIQNDSNLLLSTLPVLAVHNSKSEYYGSSIKILSEYITNHKNFEKIPNKVSFESLGPQKITEFILSIVHQINSNKNLNAICIGCVFSRVVEWNEWGEFGECTEKCTKNNIVGVKERRRTCNTGRDIDCQKYSHGVPHHQVPCNVYSCDDLEWGEWFITECTEKCGGGKQTRIRKCKTGKNDDCTKYIGGNDEDSIECNEYNCDDLKWSDWVISGECSKGCDGGTQTRTRWCQTGQKDDCVKYIGGNDEDTIDCNIHSCYNVFCRAGGVFC